MQLLRTLTPNVPNVELKSVMHQRLDVEALGGGDCGDVLIRQLPQDGGLASVVKPQHQDAGLRITETLPQDMCCLNQSRSTLEC